MDVLNGGWAPSKRHAFALPVIQGNRWVGHEIQPNILRARPFRLYRYTGREERNLEGEEGDAAEHDARMMARPN